MTEPFDRLLAFVRERQSITDKRAVGLPPPWTTDPILQRYRFCSVRREDDRVTRWIRENWRDPNKSDPDLWFAMVVARFLNLPDSLSAVGYPAPWDRRHFLGVLRNRKDGGQRNFSAAYIVSTCGRVCPKEVYVADTLDPLWRDRAHLRPCPGDTLNSWHMALGQFRGLGSFMAAQVVADVKYAPPLDEASDWATFAASGPGSRRGLNRLVGRDKDVPWREDDWRLELARQRERLNVALGWVDPLHAQDSQNCLCEWDKHERARLGEGRPKQLYPGGGT